MQVFTLTHTEHKIIYSDDFRFRIDDQHANEGFYTGLWRIMSLTDSIDACLKTWPMERTCLFSTWDEAVEYYNKNLRHVGDTPLEQRRFRDSDNAEYGYMEFVDLWNKHHRKEGPEMWLKLGDMVRNERMTIDMGWWIDRIK